MYKRQVVVGGGNVAIDVARTATRTGGEAVAMYCLESRAEMPALDEEVEEAEAEDVYKRQVSLSDLGTMAFQTVVLFAAAVAGIFIIGYLLPGWKLVGDRDLAVGIGVEQFLGFPSNVVICREVSEAVGQTDDEKTYIEDTLSIPYVLGGITVVTILSVTMAGIVINFL